MTQRERLLWLLEEHSGCWVDLPRILDLRIAQYGARIRELRRELEPKGYRIENRVLRSNGRVSSCFRLLPPQPPQGELDLGLCGGGRGVEPRCLIDYTQVTDSTIRQKGQKRQKPRSEVHGGSTESMESAIRRSGQVGESE